MGYYIYRIYIIYHILHYIYIIYLYITLCGLLFNRTNGGCCCLVLGLIYYSGRGGCFWAEVILPQQPPLKEYRRNETLGDEQMQTNRVTERHTSRRLFDTQIDRQTGQRQIQTERRRRLWSQTD